MIGHFHHADYPADELLERKRETVTAVLPAREVADTIGPILEGLLGLGPLIDQILVVDAASTDSTAEISRSLGAEVHQESDLVPEFGQALGKGDAMWRALSVVRGDLVLYLDADTREFSGRFATGVLGPLIAEPGVDFVKGTFERPFTSETGQRLPGGGGRVTELTARPLLSAFYPELAGFRQPLAGEVAGRRTLFESIPFVSGYAVDLAMLFDVRDAVGISRMAEADLGVRLNQHQPLLSLGPMAYAILRVILERLRRDGRLLDDHAPPPLQTADGQLIQVELVERPPFALLRARGYASR